MSKEQADGAGTGKKIRYRLFALRTTDANISALENERFCRITPKYILFYAGDEQFNIMLRRDLMYTEIREEHTSALTDSDKQWLLDCNMAIIAEETRKHREEIESSISVNLEKLEEALKRESEKISGVGKENV